MGSLEVLKANILDLLCFIEPNHIASVFFLINLNPERVPNQSKVSKYGLRDSVLYVITCHSLKKYHYHLFTRLKRQNAIFLATKQSLSFTAKSKKKLPNELKNSLRHGSPRYLARGTRDLNLLISRPRAAQGKACARLTRKNTTIKNSKIEISMSTKKQDGLSKIGPLLSHS